MIRTLLVAALLVLLVSCTGKEDRGGSSDDATTSGATTTSGGTTSGGATAAPEPTGRSLTYLSLGDSLAVGVGASDPATRGYAPLYRAALQRETGREVRLTQLGVSGETTESFVGSYPDPNASQLARAEAVLREHPTTRMTLSLGANDLLRTAERDDAARREALRRYGENLDSILTHLADASGPDARITVLALYNPAPGTFTDRWAGELNAVIRETAGRHGAAVAAGDDAFRGREADYARFIRSGNIHPTDEGYAALARAFAEAMPRARTPD